MANKRPEAEGSAPNRADRRRFLTAASGVAMVTGLAGGYGALGLVAGRFLYPARPGERRWMFVAEAERLGLGDSLLYRGPSGETINVTRRAVTGEATDFVALSSVCPHLGCHVHWEAQNNRYFCPCHNGVFDPEGRGIGGPPGDAGQSLTSYEVDVDGGLMYIRVAVTRLGARDACGEVIEAPRSRAGHDPCLSPLAQGDAASDEKAVPSKGARRA